MGMAGRQLRAALIAFALCLFLCLAGPASAQQPDGERFPYPLPEFDKGQFGGSGIVTTVGEEEGQIVINDQLFLLTPETEYYTSYMAPLSQVYFTAGTEVEFIAGKKKEILKIWLLE